MAGATVIDQLIVKLGLDPSDFSKGQKKAASEVVSMEKEVKKSSASMSQSLLSVSGKLLGIATAAAAVKKVIGYGSDMSVTLRQLGIDARNFGVAANEMRNFQNISEMMGGKAEETTRSIANITKAVYDLAYNGQISDSLIMLGRLGVRFQDTAGNAREFRDIVLDTERAIQQALKSGTSRENANQMLLQAGFDPGLAQAMLEGTVSQQLAQQEARRQVTGDVLKAAEDWEKSAANRNQEVAAAATRALPAQAAAGMKANEVLAGGANFLSEATVKGTADRLMEKAEQLSGRARANMWVKGRENYEGTIQSAASKYGINPELLAGVLSTESGFNPAAVNAKSGATGIAQLMPKYFPGAGKNPHEDIFTAAEFLRTLHDSFVKSGDADDAGAWYLALQSYNAGQTRVRRSMDGSGRPLAQETLDYPGKVLDYASGATPTPNAQGGRSGGASNSTDVSIGKVEINTQATEADGIARDFAGATRRKFQAAQADAGMQ